MTQPSHLTPDDLYALRESYEVEFKSAQGRDGRGAADLA